MPVKAVFFDIDGTLVSFRTHRIPASTLEAVRVVRRKGVRVYIATGRPPAFIDNLGELEYDGMITATGAHCVARDGTVLCHRPVPAADVERIVAHHRACPEEAFPIFFVCDDGVFVTRLTDEVSRVAGLLNIGLPPMRPIEEVIGRDVLQIISFFPAADEERYMTLLMPGCVSMRWHPAFTDAVAAGVSKSAGIDCVLAHEGIALADTIAFGDGGNDTGMLRHVACGVAMGNAADEVKAAADYVTDSVDEDGVARAFRHFGLLDD